MSIEKTRRSLVFHLWVRLTAITAVFTLIAIGAFLWLEMGDNLDAAREHAQAQAAAAAGSFAGRARENQSPPPTESPATGATTEALGIRGVQMLNSDGSIRRSIGDMNEDDALLPADVTNVPSGHDASLSATGFVQEGLSPLDLILGGEYGLVYVLETPSGPGGAQQIDGPPYTRVVLEYDNISGEAQVLLLRSLALAGAILAVAALTIWVLLNHFVAQPLSAYNATARRIASGEQATMPDLGAYEFAQLGQTIDEMAAALRHEASIDGLTGLNNVRHLGDTLPALLGEAILRGEQLAVLVCDLDNMKQINDTFGHHAGDLALQTVAREMTQWAADDFTCWRTGGDEFVVAMPETSRSVADGLGWALQRKVAAARNELMASDIAISMSFGVSTFPEDGDSVGLLLNAADHRMYESKARKKADTLASAA